MIPKNLRYKDSFILNGYFEAPLDSGWVISDRQKVTRQTGLWGGEETPFMHATNAGEGHQEIALALFPRPMPEKADYELSFWYEVYGNKNATARIQPSLGGQLDVPLVSSLKMEPLETVDPPVLLELDLRQYSGRITLEPEETAVTITFISATKDNPIQWGGLRVTFVRVELLLEPLRLVGVTIDDEPQLPDEPLHLCFGALDSDAHEVSLNLAVDSAWEQTKAALLVEGGNSDPVLSARPAWEREQPIDSPWYISCAATEDDPPKPHKLTVNVRSQYTAELCDLCTESGHFRLDVIMLKEAEYYPVIDLAQSVELRVQVKSHYLPLPLSGREVTWTLTPKDGSAPFVLFKQPSDENGEASYTYTPRQPGEFQITASVDSYYKKDDAKHVFQVRALQQDPWLEATFSLDGSSSSSIWGGDLAYPCRGASHKVTITFPTGHALAGTDLALGWEGEDTPGRLQVVISPELDTMTTLEENALKWNMVFKDLRNSSFHLYVRCSRLLEASPLQDMSLAHNWVAIEATKQSSRFPVVNNPDLRLEVQVRSEVPDVGTVSGVDVEWLIDDDDDPSDTVSTGDDGWSLFSFALTKEGPFTIIARVASPYKDDPAQDDFKVLVLGESPWQSLATVTLDGREAGTVGLVCFLGDEQTELRICLKGDGHFLNEEIWLGVTSADGESEFGFESDPPLDSKRELTEEGLTWKISPTVTESDRFLLHVFHEELDALEVPGLLLSKVLDDEGRFEFDEKPLHAGTTAYPCLGGKHELRFIPKAHSPLISLEVAASWAQQDLQMILNPLPDDPQNLVPAGAKWSLDCEASVTGGETGLSLVFPQIDWTYPSVSLSLGHNRVEVTEARDPSFDPQVGESVLLELKVRSHYTWEPLQGIQVSFKHGAASTPVSSLGTGWARFLFTAEEPGEATVIATVPSPYDGPDGEPTHQFDIVVLGR